MKKFLMIIGLIFLSSNSYAANIKISALTTDTTPTADDLIVTVNAPAGTPANRSVALGDLSFDLFTDVTGEGTSGWVMKDDGDGTYSFVSFDVALDAVNLSPTSGTWDLSSTTLSYPSNSVDSADINIIVESISWNAGGIVADGTQCADPAKITLNGGPTDYTIICTDNNAASMYGHVVMPDSYNGGTLTFELEYVQTAADTNILNADICAMCRGNGETINSTWGVEVALDDAAVSGSNIVNHLTSAAVTPNGTCAGGDTLYWRIQIAEETTTAVATLHFLGVKAEYTSNVGD